MTSGGRARSLRAELATVLMGHVCLHATLTGGRMAAPLFALEHGHGAAGAGVLVALFSFSQIFLSLPAGRYADRHGLLRPLGLSVIAAIAGVGLAAIWPVYAVLGLSAMLVGGAVGAATIALQRHAGRLAQNTIELKQVFSWLAVAPAVSAFVGPMVAGFAIDHASFRMAFAVLAFFPGVAWMLMRRAREQEPAGGGARPPPSGTAWDLLREPAMRRLLLVNWLMTAAWDLHGFMVPVLGHERGLPASAIGTLLGSFAIAAACIRFSLPLVARRIREWALVTGAIASGGVMFLVYPFAPNAPLMAVCSALLGMILGMIQPMVMSMLHQITPHHRQGEALGVRLIMVNLSSAGMPLLLGVAGSVLGAAGVFWTVGSILSLGSRVGFRLRQDVEAVQRDHPPGP